MLLEEPLEWLVPPAWQLAQPTFVLYEVFPSALQIVMLGFALVWALRETEADRVEARRKTRAVLVVVSVAHIVLALLVERLALQIWALPIGVYFPVHAGIIALTVIRAPFSGVAVSTAAQPGEMISPVSAGGRLYAHRRLHHRRHVVAQDRGRRQRALHQPGLARLR